VGFSGGVKMGEHWWLFDEDWLAASLATLSAKGHTRCRTVTLQALAFPPLAFPALAFPALAFPPLELAQCSPELVIRLAGRLRFTTSSHPLEVHHFWVPPAGMVPHDIPATFPYSC
jgi:hypothetical protein